MKQGETFGAGDKLHRLVKQAIDSGACKTIAEAEAMFRRYRLHLVLGESDAHSAEHQAALLTCVALARRVCLGGVTVDLRNDAELVVPLPLARSLSEAVGALGGTIATGAADTPTVVIGDSPQSGRNGFQVRTTYAGWRGGIVPARSNVHAEGPRATPPACMLAAALAVNEAYLFMSTGASAWGRRVTGLSLWSPNSDTDWLVPSADEPLVSYLPSRLWLIGLGHLGQAFLWGLGLLPFPDPSQLQVVLQDTDIITPSTESTSVLSDATLIGQKKTRAMATWAERRGFRTSIQERMFDGSFRRQQSEPAIALCGIDNAIGRGALDQVGFDLVIEAGLGHGFRDFQTMRLHTLPGPRAAADIWSGGQAANDDVTDREAYRRLTEEGVLDQCGVTLLAGKAVGAPFVGAAAATMVLSEVLRVLHGGPTYQLIDLDLKCIEHRNVVSHPGDFSHLNPGYVTAAP